MNRPLAVSPLLDQLQYFILPGKLPLGSPYTSLHNQAYEYFKTFWRRVFVDNGLNEPVHFEHDFYRMDYVNLLMHGSTIVGLIMHSVFNLRLSAHQDHEYFANNSGNIFLADLKERNANSALTMEYFSVDPHWRKSHCGLSLGPILISLGTRIQRACGVDASLGRAREDVGTNRMFEGLGAQVLLSNVSMYNTPISIMVAYSNNVRDLPDISSRRYVNKFWNERIDVSGSTDAQKSFSKVA